MAVAPAEYAGPAALRLGRNLHGLGTPAASVPRRSRLQSGGNGQLDGLDPQAYLRDLLERIADHPINRIDEPLPWNFVQAGQERRAA
jgi:hypothetical protein